MGAEDASEMDGLLRSESWVERPNMLIVGRQGYFFGFFMRLIKVRLREQRGKEIGELRFMEKYGSSR